VGYRGTSAPEGPQGERSKSLTRAPWNKKPHGTSIQKKTFAGKRIPAAVSRTIQKQTVATTLHSVFAGRGCARGGRGRAFGADSGISPARVGSISTYEIGLPPAVIGAGRRLTFGGNKPRSFLREAQRTEAIQALLAREGAWDCFASYGNWERLGRSLG